MEADLDMNSFRVMNLSGPVEDHDPVRLIELTNALDAFRVAATITGTVNATQMLLGSGTAAAPCYTFTIDSDTGFFRATGDGLGIAANGTEIARFIYSTPYTAPILGVGTTTPGANPASSGYPLIDGGIDVGGKIMLHPQQDSVYIYGAFASTAYFADTTSTSHGWAAGLVGTDTYGYLYTTHAFSITPPHDTLTTVGVAYDPYWVYLQTPTTTSASHNPSWSRGPAIGYSFDSVGATSFLNRNQSLGTTEFVFSAWNDVISKNIVFIRSAGGNLEVDAQNATDIPLIVKGAASQSQVLTLWRDSASTTLASITKEGNLSIANGVNLTFGGGTIPTGIFSDGSNIAIRTFATTAKMYFQNASAATTFGDWDTTRLNVTTALTVTGAISSIGALGYATTAGGAVTQGTSRTTGVTLNKLCGAITLFSAAGSATPATFTVTNSTVAATDVVNVSQKSGTDKHEVFVTNTTAGTFDITFFTTGGTTTEQPVFNFAVLKAVTS